MRFVAECLTPVHVGTGNMLHPFEYVVRNGNYYVLSLDAALEALEREVPGALERYAEYASQILGAVASRQKDRKMVAEQAGIIHFCERALRRSDIAARLLTDASVLRYRVSGVAWEPHQGYHEIREQMKTASGPTIPGSSLKGSLRSSLAYGLLVQMPREEFRRWLAQFPNGRNSISGTIGRLKGLYRQLEEALERSPQRAGEVAREVQKWRDRLEKRVGEPVEQYLFRCGVQKEHGISFREPQMDLLRALRVSDALRSDAELTVDEVRAVATKQTDQQGAIIPCELIAEGSRFEFEMVLDAGLLREMARAARKGKGQWLGFEEKFRRLFDEGPERLFGLGPAQLAEWAEEKLALLFHKAERHSREILQRDLSWVRSAQGLGERTLEARLRKLGESGDGAWLLRLGFGSGWHATTVALALEAQGEEELLSDLLYVFQMDLPQNVQKLLRPGRVESPKKRDEALRLLRRRPEARAFPTSRRLVFGLRGEVLPLGWIRVRPGELEGARRGEGNETGSSKKAPAEVTPEMLEQLRRHFRGEG